MPRPASPRPKRSPLDSPLVKALSSLHPSNWGLFSLAVFSIGGLSWYPIAISLYPLLNNWALSYVGAGILSLLLIALLLFLGARLSSKPDAARLPGNPSSSGATSVEAPEKAGKIPQSARQLTGTPARYATQKRRDHSCQPLVGRYMTPVIIDNPILAWQMSRLTGQSHVSSPSQGSTSSPALPASENQPRPDETETLS
jgi:hypothetical protein